MGSQRVGHDWATDLVWSDPIVSSGRAQAGPQKCPASSRVKATFPVATTLCAELPGATGDPVGQAPQSQEQLGGDASEFGSCSPQDTSWTLPRGHVERSEASSWANTAHHRWESRDPQGEGALSEPPYLRSSAMTGALGLLTSFPTVHKRVKTKSLPSKDLVQNPAV